MFLGKRLKYVFFEILSDSDSGIFDYKSVICCPIPADSLFYLDKYGTSGPVIFERIVNNIRQDLLQIERTSDQPAMPDINFFQHQTNPRLFRLNR